MTIFNRFKAFRLYLLGLVAGSVIFSAVPAGAQDGKDARSAKITPALIELHEQQLVRDAQGSRAALRAPNRRMNLVGELVIVDAVAEDDAETLRAELEALGMQNAVVSGRIVSGELPVSAIAAAGDLRSLRFAREASAGTHAGSVTSQGDAAMHADVARTSFGVDGTGVKVGVLSDSFNCLGGAAGDVASGDLSTVQVGQEISSCSGATGDGRALLQVGPGGGAGPALRSRSRGRSTAPPRSRTTSKR